MQIRTGLHRGPAILVNMNGKLDYFGTAINKAARVEAISGPGEISLSAEVFEDQAVNRLLKESGIPAVRRRSLKLKGLHGDQAVFSFSLPEQTIDPAQADAKGQTSHQGSGRTSIPEAQPA